MKLTNDQLEGAAYIFEKAHGNRKTDYEEEMIMASSLTDLSPGDLEKVIVDGLNTGVYEDSFERVSAYWALSKRFNKDLIPAFKNWLKKELVLADPRTVYQLLIALGNIGEPVFNPDREGGSSVMETELNLRDATDYLTKSN